MGPSLVLAAALVGSAPSPPVHLERADLLTYDERTGRSTASGDVRLRRDSFVLEAETATLVGTIVEAEGDVRISDGVDLLTGTRARYDMADGSGEVLEARGRWAGVNVRADRLVMTDTARAVAEAGWVSPCDLDAFFAPVFKAERFEIVRGRRIRARFLRVQVGTIPILFFPVLSLPAPEGFPGAKTAPSMQFAVGRGDFEGVFVKTGVEYDAGAYGRGTIRVDFRDRVGWALGEDHVLRHESGTLTTSLYWADVRDATSRWRGRGRYLGDITDRLSFRAQLHRVSDRAFLRDFFFREYLDEEPPANDATFTYRGDAWIGRLTWVGNPNRDEFVETERSPELEVRWLPRRLPGGFVFEGEAAVARLGFEDENGGDTEYSRARGRARLSRPTPIGAFTLTPFAEADVARYTSDDRTLAGGTRSLPAGGSTLETLLVGRLGPRWRHILRPSVTFEHVERAGLDPLDVIERDPEDRVRDGDVLTFKVDNHFVRRRADGSRRRVGRVLLTTFYDPDRKPNEWGDVRIDARLSPNDRLGLEVEAAYDPNENVLERADVEVSYDAGPWSATAHLVRSNGRKPQADQLQVGGGARGRITERWSGEVYASFDAEAGVLDQARYGFTYRGDCWTVGIGFEDRRQIDRDTVFVQFGLTPFGEPAEVKLGGL